jgi:diguanylate cyclase (GGDEF)-like protein
LATDQLFIIISAVLAALLGGGALLAMFRSRGEGAEEPEPALPVAQEGSDKYEVPSDEATLGGASYGTAIRVLWWVSIAAVLIGVGVADAYPSSQPAIYILGAVAVAVVVLVHDLLPLRFRTMPVAAIEVAAALALVTALLVLTGYGNSPFVYIYDLVAVAVALAGGGAVALSVAAVATLCYLGVLWVDPDLGSYAGADYLRFVLNMGSIWLLAYLAGVFASAERRVRAAVVKMSRIDPLTGLFNRSQLFLMLEQEVQRTRRSERGFCLLMIDLDGLKAVNDTFGHHRGDEVLRLLGGVIRNSIRTLDNAYRLGGDEFLVLLPETDFVGAFVVAEKIRDGAEEVGFTVGGGELLTSVSIGLVSCPEDGRSGEELMIAADRAMYQAKSLGKNQVSGNPRPRRLAHRPNSAAQAPAAPAPPAVAVAAVPVTEEAAETVSVAEPAPVIPEPPGVERGQRADRAGVPSASLIDAETYEPAEDEEPDPGEFRRHIAAAQRNLDPDYQIRRAMDAFLSPTHPNGERD